MYLKNYYYYYEDDDEDEGKNEHFWSELINPAFL